MKKLLTIVFLLFGSTAAIYAQKPDANDAFEIRKEMRKERIERRLVPSAVLPSDVGEADSFGRNVKFMGTAVGGSVIIYRSCDPQILLDEQGVTLGPDDRCVAHDPATTTTTRATFDDIGRINLPGRSADNVVYYLLNNYAGADLFNPDSVSKDAFFFYGPQLTLESAALNDPAALDQDGNPLNGRLTLSVFGSRFVYKTIASGGTDSHYDRYTSAATSGLSRSFFTDYGLPQNVINRLYRLPMTIKLGVRVNVRGPVYFGEYSSAARFMGN
ncbi:MAG: hypothetical protein ACT4O9_03790 [Blastocatellia bacterium]